MKKWFWVAVLVVIADQAVKELSIRLVEDITLIPGILCFTHARNTGMSFGLFSGHSWLLGVVSVVIILIVWRTLRPYRLGTLSRTASMLLLGGAVGNMIDRFFRGYVVDMFMTLFMHFAVFNVADAALTIGILLMAVSLYCRPEEWREKDGSTADGGEAD